MYFKMELSDGQRAVEMLQREFAAGMIQDERREGL